MCRAPVPETLGAGPFVFGVLAMVVPGSCSSTECEPENSRRTPEEARSIPVVRMHCGFCVMKSLLKVGCILYVSTPRRARASNTKPFGHLRCNSRCREGLVGAACAAQQSGRCDASKRSGLHNPKVLQSVRTTYCISRPRRSLSSFSLEKDA